MVCSVLIVCLFIGSFFFFVVVVVGAREIHFQNVKMSYKIENVCTKLDRISLSHTSDTARSIVLVTVNWLCQSYIISFVNNNC